MILSPAFESLERYERINKLIAAILAENGLHPYEWLRPWLVDALKREKNFMMNNKNRWVDDLGLHE